MTTHAPFPAPFGWLGITRQTETRVHRRQCSSRRRVHWAGKWFTNEPDPEQLQVPWATDQLKNKYTHLLWKGFITSPVFIIKLPHQNLLTQIFWKMQQCIFHDDYEDSSWFTNVLTKWGLDSQFTKDDQTVISKCTFQNSSYVNLFASQIYKTDQIHKLYKTKHTSIH